MCEDEAEGALDFVFSPVTTSEENLITLQPVIAVFTRYFVACKRKKKTRFKSCFTLKPPSLSHISNNEDHIP